MADVAEINLDTFRKFSAGVQEALRMFREDLRQFHPDFLRLRTPGDHLGILDYWQRRVERGQDFLADTGLSPARAEHWFGFLPVACAGQERPIETEYSGTFESAHELTVRTVWPFYEHLDLRTGDADGNIYRLQIPEILRQQAVKFWQSVPDLDCLDGAEDRLKRERALGLRFIIEHGEWPISAFLTRPVQPSVWSFWGDEPRAVAENVVEPSEEEVAEEGESAAGGAVERLPENAPGEVGYTASLPSTIWQKVFRDYNGGTNYSPSGWRKVKETWMADWVHPEDLRPRKHRTRIRRDCPYLPIDYESRIIAAAKQLAEH